MITWLKTIGWGLVKPILSSWKFWVVIAFVAVEAFAGYQVYQLGVTNTVRRYAEGTTVTPRPIDIPPVEGESEGTPVAVLDSSAFKRRIAELLGLYRNANATAFTYKTEKDSLLAVIGQLRHEMNARDGMIEALSTEKTGKDSVREGTMVVRFNPLVEFPRGKFWMRFDPAPVMAYDTTRNVVTKLHLLDLFVAVDFGGRFGVKGTAGMMSTGVHFNIGSVQLTAGLGLASQNNKTFGLWRLGGEISTR